MSYQKRQALAKIIQDFYADKTREDYVVVDGCTRREWAQVADAEAEHTTLALDVREFMEAAGQDTNAKPVLHPNLRNRVRWLHEEVAELEHALQDNDLTGIADALVDIVYITLGGAVECGVPFGRVWSEVHRSNMAKVPFDPKTGEHRVTRAPDGKVQKPQGWRAPDIGSVLRVMGYRPKGES